LTHVPLLPDDRLLVGLEGPDDAAVYLLDNGQAVAATLDFFTPLVDDPRDFGAIAAANALSDLYAMRATPLFALNILAVPAGKLPPEVVGAILAGAGEICREAGIPIAGGHSIDDPEPKFGLVALGLLDPESFWRKGGARPGDALVLGKALGTGLIATAHKRDTVDPRHLEAAVTSMRQLNRDAANALGEFDPSAVTDVSGFGLLGHLAEVCRASGVSATVRASAPCLLPGAVDLAAQGCAPGGTGRNLKGVVDILDWDAEVSETMQFVLADPQTSGVLLAALPPERAEAAVEALVAAGYAAAVIGACIEASSEGPRITVHS